MTQPLYLQPNQVAIAPGRFQDLWFALADPSNAATQYQNGQQPTQFSANQLEWVMEASRTIDDLTGQDGGLLTQTNKTRIRQLFENTDTIFLPNKPLTAVSALTVRRGQSLTTFDLSAPGTIEILSNSQTFTYIPGGTVGSVPSGIMALTYSADGVYWPFAEGDRLAVTYSCGYDPSALPSVITDCCRRILAESLLSQIENPLGAQEVRQGRAQIRFGTEVYVNSIDIRTRRALLPYCVNKV